MEVVHGIESLERRQSRLFIVVGVFDGIHRGHTYLLRRLVAEARRRDARPAVITFDHHPDEILTGTAPPLLIDPDERVERLARAGVAVTVVQHFDAALRATPYEAFVGRIMDRTGLAGFLMTPDAAFGYQRAGTPVTLADLGRRVDPQYEVVVVPPFVLDGAPVRSSDIRTAIAAGDLQSARRLLGRAHAVVGRREDVSRRADSPGTALAFEMPVALPPAGAYAARVGPPLDGTGFGGRTTVVEVEDGSVRIAARRPRRELARVAFVGSAIGG